MEAHLVIFEEADNFCLVGFVEVLLFLILRHRPQLARILKKRPNRLVLRHCHRRTAPARILLRNLQICVLKHLHPLHRLAIPADRTTARYHFSVF